MWLQPTPEGKLPLNQSTESFCHHYVHSFKDIPLYWCMHSQQHVINILIQWLMPFHGVFVKYIFLADFFLPSYSALSLCRVNLACLDCQDTREDKVLR